MNITVYLGASRGNDPSYEADASALGAWIAEHGHTLIYGGSRTGLMGALSAGALKKGGAVIGVEPQEFIDTALQQEGLTKLIVTPDMASRKAKMMEVLPIRPLILGGDDITFICPARLALTYTKRFMTALNQYFASCAGIAILPTAYPFFRGYKLAEQACDAAKVPSRGKKTSQASKKEETPESSCWLDFVILHGEQAPELDQIRKTEYKGDLGNMHFGPYRVDKDGEEHSLAKLLVCTEDFMKMPANKVKELRFTAQKGKADIRLYLEQLKHMGLRLPRVDGWERFEDTVWNKKDGSAAGQTPYVDAIEIMDYYVPELQ